VDPPRRPDEPHRPAGGLLPGGGMGIGGVDHGHHQDRWASLSRNPKATVLPFGKSAALILAPSPGSTRVRRVPLKRLWESGATLFRPPGGSA